jgi:DNA-binding transcriptional LysR family regulator
MNLRSLDLNLLVVLQALLEHRHVTKAAAELNMSQPAVSRALSRLRTTFNDQLLVRTTKGYDLSARAYIIQQHLEQVLGSIDKLVTAPQFDPQQSKETVRIYGLDPEISMIVPTLFSKLRNEAPSMLLDVRSEPMEQFNLLDSGEVHFALSGFTPESGMDHYRRLNINRPQFVVMMHQQHPLANKPITLNDYLDAAHGMISITGRGPALMDNVIGNQGRKLDTPLRLSSFTNVAQFCEAGDLLFHLPRSYAEQISKGRPLVLREIPQELDREPVSIDLYWHERHHHNPMCQWVRNQIREIVNTTSEEEL